MVRLLTADTSYRETARHDTLIPLSYKLSFLSHNCYLVNSYCNGRALDPGRPRARHKKMEGGPRDDGDENHAFRTPKDAPATI
jgi:hypothetical protein